MGTPFSNIYERFSNKITDYSFSNLTQNDAEKIFLKYLKSAVAKFTQCDKDLYQRDDITQEFVDILSEIEEEILASFMVEEWIKQKINHSNLMEQHITSKDYKIYSPANLLKEISETKKEISREIDNLIIQYSYNNDLSDLR